MANENSSAVLGRKHGLSAALDHFFRFSERGSSLKTEIGAGCIAFFVAVCALIMNTQIIGSAYGNYAGRYLAATLLCFAGSLLLGILCNLPLVQSANMALSTAVISMLSAAPDPVRTEVTEQQAGGPGGMPGGGMAGFEVEPAPFTFEEGAETISYVIGSHDYFHTTGTLVDSADGVKYTYQLAKGDPQAPFDCKMFLYLNEDGTARLTVSAEGPVAAADLSGAWTADGGNITVNF